MRETDSRYLRVSHASSRRDRSETGLTATGHSLSQSTVDDAILTNGERDFKPFKVCVNENGEHFTRATIC